VVEAKEEEKEGEDKKEPSMPEVKAVSKPPNPSPKGRGRRKKSTSRSVIYSYFY
jgi:hypothetical protein